MKKVKIVGVPEHFNFPWHLAISENAFRDRGIDLEWTDIPEGTGKMCELLRNNETDLAIILTEGIVKSITDGNPVKIIQEYIGTPLLWGIHVAAKSPYQTISELEGSTAAISRYGSGSHLMAFLHAQNEEWSTEKLKFSVVNNLNGAVEALTEAHADYFMWEHFTTKPLVDNGVFRRLDDYSTPWPCFVIAAREGFIEQHKGSIKHILEVINTYTSDFKNIPSIDRSLANSYDQKLNDIQQWLSITQWSQEQIQNKTLVKVNTTLKELGLIDNELPVEKLVY